MFPWWKISCKHFIQCQQIYVSVPTECFSIQTHSVSRWLQPVANCQGPVMAAGLSRGSPSPSKCVDFTHFVWEGGNESSGPGELLRGREKWNLPKAKLRQPVVPDTSPSQDTYLRTKENRWNLTGNCALNFPMRAINTVFKSLYITKVPLLPGCINREAVSWAGLG